jgi:hypothetical protein
VKALRQVESVIEESFYSLEADLDVIVDEQHAQHICEIKARQSKHLKCVSSLFVVKFQV